MALSISETVVEFLNLATLFIKNKYTNDNKIMNKGAYCNIGSLIMLSCNFHVIPALRSAYSNRLNLSLYFIFVYCLFFSMNYHTLNTTNQIYIEKALALERTKCQIETMSRRIAEDIQNMDINGVDPNLVNFIRAKRIIHEALIDHYIIPQSGIMIPVGVQNNCNVVIRYKSIQYDILIDVTMAVAEDTYSFHLDNLTTEDSKLITISIAEVEYFVNNTNRSIQRRETKFDEIHGRIREFLLGKKAGSRTETPIVDPDEIAEFPVWWKV